MKGTKLKVTKSVEKTIVNFLEKGLDKKCFDIVLIPLKVPAGDSFAWVLVQDKSLLADANPLPPVMTVQGAKALSSVARKGKMSKRIAVVMRPCEIRAVIELSKSNQIDLENILLISIDCPGALPLKNYIENPKESENKFNEILRSAQNDKGTQNDIQWGNESTRPICQVCDKFTGTDIGACQSDLHIGILGVKDGNISLIPNSKKGEDILNEMSFPVEKLSNNWENKVKELVKVRKEKREKLQEELKPQIVGLDNLLETFSTCINCQNCQNVCPVCYCRQCYFESEKMKLTSDDYLMRAESKGGLVFPPDALLFHIGRMTHMSLSCIGCGACEDACPMSIKVAQIFSFVGDKSQEVFNYTPGKSIEDALPLKVFEEDEFHTVET